MRLPVQAEAVSRTGLQADCHRTTTMTETAGVKASCAVAPQRAAVLAPVQSLPVIRFGALGTMPVGIGASTWWDSGFWKDQFEDIWNGFEQAFSATMNAVQNVASQIANAFTSAGQTFYCGQWVTQMLSCASGNPAQSIESMTSSCIQQAEGIPSVMTMCAGLAAAMFPLSQAYCNQISSNPDGGAALTAKIIGQVCPG